MWCFEKKIYKLKKVNFDTKMDIFFLISWFKNAIKGVKKRKGKGEYFKSDMRIWVFLLNIAKFGIYLHYSHCLKLFRELRKESEFRQRCCQNSTKVWKRKRKSRREKILNYGNGITEIPAAQTYWLRNQLWQCHCWNRRKKIYGNYGNAIAENRRKKKIVVVEITYEELKKKKCYVYNIFTTFLHY